MLSSTLKAFCETKLPWEVSLRPGSDGYYFVAATFGFCLLSQFVTRHFALLFIGKNSPKRGAAPRLAVKLVSILFDMVAVAGGVKELVAPEAAVLEDPIYGFSSHSQFHFAVAAGYFAWAAVATLMYRGSKVSLAHHVVCCLVYLFTLRPFLHHIGNLFLLFQASTLFTDLASCSKLMSQPKWSRVLNSASSTAFLLVRLVVGLPMSLFFVADMVQLLASGSVHSVVVVSFMVAANAVLNSLNLYWGFGMLFGMYAKPACSPGDDTQTNYFDVGFSISFGVREKASKEEAQERRRVQAPSSVLKHLDKFVSVNVFLSSVVVGVLGVLAGVDQLVLDESSTVGLQAASAVGLLAVMYGAFYAFETLGPKIFTEASSTGSGRPLYTRIRGQWYDLQKFKHPGGPVALALAEGRDATALFESHHYLMDHKRLYQVLGKYRVPDEVATTLKTMDPRDDGAHYDWDAYDKDPFTQDIKKMVLDHFRPEAERRGISIRQATKATPQRWCMIIGLMAAFFATLPAYVKGSWWTIVATPVLAWLVIANYWHDGLHFSLSCDWRINAILPYLFPWLSSPWLWYHQHVIGHHCYTNIGHKDPDLAHAPQLMREHESIRWRPAHATQESLSRVLLIWSVAVGAGLQILSDVRANLKGSYNNVVPYKLMEGARLYAHTAGRVFYTATLFVWPYFCFPLWKAFIWAVLPITIFSWCFMLNSQINHLTTNTAHASDPHFIKHQIVTAQDFGAQSWWCAFFSGGLNQQIEHHIFPCINHCHLPALQPKVKALCEKHNVQYNEVPGYMSALQSHLEHTSAMGIRPFSDED